MTDWGRGRGGIHEYIPKMIQERQSIDIPADVKEQLLVEMSSQIEAALDSKLNAGMSRDQVEEMIAALLAVYDADKTGRSDYALEPAGIKHQTILTAISVGNESISL